MSAIEKPVRRRNSHDLYVRTMEIRGPQIQAARRKWNAENPHKRKAHYKVQAALKSGTLKRPAACEDCGKLGRVDGHHEDYTRPLDVNWVCVSCHRFRHDTPKHRDISTAARGEACPWAKLTAKLVSQIRQRVASGETQSALSREFKVANSLINQIIKRRIWKSVK